MVNHGAPEDGGGEHPTPLSAVAAVVDGAGVSARRLREVIGDLADGPWPLEELIRRTAVPRRTVEALLRAAGADVESGQRGVALRADRVAAYRERFGLAQLESTRLGDPVERRLAECGELVTRVGRDIASAPGSREALDQVSATPETVVRRAAWLDGMFDLAGRRLLCVGDHDLTSLAMCALNPDLDVTVVDIDERLLEFIDRAATARRLRLRCLYADCRFGLPEDTARWADIVITDPPYTPEGAQVFLGRGLQGLRDRAGGRLVMAYGFSDLAPALGAQVQRAVLDLGLVIEVVLPAFNRYQGAQAVGSASDLYVCRPTARTWKVLDRRLERAAVNIYTRGEQALEGRGKRVTDVELDAVNEAAAAGLPAGAPVIMVNGQREGARNIPLGRVLKEGLPAASTRQRPVAVAADLSSDPGPWLLRLLLAANADRLAILVPNEHPDVGNEAGQRALAGLVAAKYTLRFRRSTPAPRSAIVEAVTVAPDSLDDGRGLVRRLLDRAHGRVGNVWREGLIGLSRRGGAALTQKEGRALVRDSTARQEILDSRVVDLPRHRLRDLFSEVAASAERVR